MLKIDFLNPFRKEQKKQRLKETFSDILVILTLTKFILENKVLSVNTYSVIGALLLILVFFSLSLRMNYIGAIISFFALLIFLIELGGSSPYAIVLMAAAVILFFLLKIFSKLIK